MKFIAVFILFVSAVFCEIPLPSAKPLVCFAFLSCGRQHLLEETVGSVFEHIQRYEPTLKYETVWIDQVPSNITSQLAQKYPFTVRIVAAHAMGRIWPYNTAIFELCTAPYVVLLEEDFPFIRGVETSLIRPDFVQEAVEVIESDPRISGVLFRSEAGPDTWNNTYTEFQTNNGVQWCFRRTAKLSWSSFTTGVSLYSIARIRTVGLMDPKLSPGERDYNDRLYKSGFALANVKRRTECTVCSSVCSAVGWHSGDKESTYNKVNKCTGRVIYGF